MQKSKILVYDNFLVPLYKEICRKNLVFSVKKMNIDIFPNFWDINQTNVTIASNWNRQVQIVESNEYGLQITM